MVIAQLTQLRNYYVIRFAIVLWNCIIQRARNGTWTVLEDLRRFWGYRGDMIKVVTVVNQKGVTRPGHVVMFFGDFGLETAESMKPGAEKE